MCQERQSSKMVDIKCLVIVVLTLINWTKCELNHNIHKRVSEINNRSREMYGEVPRSKIKRDFDLEKLMYPRGNKRKLSAISQAWRDYYDCSASQLAAVTEGLMVQNNVIVMVFQGATARVPCTLCQEPGQEEQYTWLYSNLSATGNFELIQGQDRMSEEHGMMTIYNVMPEDEGVFSCTQGSGGGGLVFIEVVDKEPYNVVKPPESRGPHAVSLEVYEGVILYSQWSPWSECSVCGQVGRRHRHGMCYVKLDQDLIVNYLIDSVNTASRFKLFELDDKIIELFQTFPEGVPCRSQYLPQIIKDLDIVKQRPSEIMIGLCKVPCKSNKAKQRTDDQNGTLIYPITRALPKQPPPPDRNTIFADFGQRVVMRCPGTTLRDVPIQWRVGTKILVPRDVDKGSGGRVYLNSRDHLVFTAVLYEDDNLYSCWQRSNLAGTVKLVVWCRRVRSGHVSVLLAGLLLAGAARGLLRMEPQRTVLYHVY